MSYTDMRQLTVYECQHCKKLFRTSNRHKCKYTPEFKNCFTCAENKGFFEEEELNFADEHGERYSKVVICDCKCGGQSLPDLIEIKYDLQCESHKLCGKWYENQFNKNRYDQEPESHFIF